MLLLSVKNFTWKRSEDMELFISVFTTGGSTQEPRAARPLCENYVIKWTRQGMARDIDQLNNFKVGAVMLGRTDSGSQVKQLLQRGCAFHGVYPYIRALLRSMLGLSYRLTARYLVQHYQECLLAPLQCYALHNITNFLLLFQHKMILAIFDLFYVGCQVGDCQLLFSLQAVNTIILNIAGGVHRPQQRGGER